MNASEPIDVASTERLRELAARFQQTWQAHRDDPKAVDLASFLPALGDTQRVDALLRLIPLDLEGRWQNGVPVSLEDYLHRFPELGPPDRVPPQLIADEYRIRAQFGVISPHSVLKQRFPNQYPAVEKLIQADPGRLFAETVAPQESSPPPKSHPVMLLPSLVVGDHYELNKLIGRGGFGEVWHATDLRGGIDKAIKILTRSADSEEAQKEFESLNIIKKINHPCLLRTESYFVERDRVFIVLELADATLRDVLKKSQAEAQTGIPVKVLLVNMKHAAEGLDFLHKQGILHRDIKPENILVVGDYGKVADFGLAKEAHNKQSTQADFAGTVVYSAPETWDGRVTTRSDQYSLAATYFELRTGRVLFGGKTFQEVFRKHLEANPDFDPLPDLEQVVLRQALSRKPEDRFATCAAFVHALEQAVLASGSKVVASEPPAAPIGTRQNNAETTFEADSAVSRVNAGLRAAAVLRSSPDQAAPKKWNDAAVGRSSRTKKRSSVAPVIAIVGFLLLVGLGAYAARETIRESLAGSDAVVIVSPNFDKQPEISAAPTLPSTPPQTEHVKPPPPLPPTPAQPPPINPARAKLTEAAKLLGAKEFAKCKEMLDGLNVRNDPDADRNRDGLALYVQLLQEGDFTREQLGSFDTAIVGHADVKPAFTAAMTKRLVDVWAEWTNNKDEWEARIRDCELADPANRLIQAIKAEAILEAGRRFEQPLPPPTDDELSFVMYVRARVAARQEKRVRAAELLASMPMDEKWLNGKRAYRAALILQEGAADLTPEKNGRLQLFASSADADRAFAWQKQALVLFGNPSFEQQNSFDWKYRLNTALAAACKSEPDFALCKTIGDSLLEKPDFDAASSAIELALVYPAGFPKEFAKFRTRLSADEIAPMLRLGETQLQASPNNVALGARQALLWYTKARALDCDAEIDPAKILEADKAALALEPRNAAYQVAVGRDAALVALALASQTAGAAERIKECERGLADSADASRSNAKVAELWPDLGRVRGMLYLDIGRNSDFTKPAAKQAFQNAIAAAKRALIISPAKPEEIAVVIGQAHEALAYLCRDDIEKNFDEAVRAYGQAVARQSRYALERGRCYYRWATDADLNYAKAKRDAKLREALDDFETLAKIPDFPAAEMNYWEALAQWDRINRVSQSPKAQKAFERSLAAAAKNPRFEGAWASYALRGLVEMNRLDAKGAPATSAEHLLAALPAWKTLSKNEILAGDGDFVAASKAYRDLLAETSFDAAEPILKFNSLAKYPAEFRAYVDRAVEMKHSSKHAAFAVSRAIHFKKHAAVLELTPQEIAAARNDAAAAIESAEFSVREPLRKQLAAGAPP